MRKTIPAPAIINPSHITQAIQNRETEIHSIQEEITSIRNKEKDVSY